MKNNFKYIAAAFLISGMLSAQKVDINKMPVAGPTPTINIAKPKTFTMKNGLTVMVVENHKLPRVSATLTMDRPPYYEGNIAGVSDIMADQLGQGTTKMTKDAFINRIDYLGANLNFSSGGAFLNSLSKYFPETFSMMADAVVNPKFDAAEIEKSKERTIESLKADEKNASGIAGRVSSALAYGKNTSRGEFETEESVKRITVADVKNNYQKYYAPDNAYLVVTGDVKFADVKKMAEQHFGSWKKSGTNFAALEPANNVATTEVNIVDVPNAVQSVVIPGNLHTMKMNDPKYFATQLGNYILGGGAESRLFMNLREKHGFTYGAGSSISTSKYSPAFMAQASVRNEVTDRAVQEFMNEIKSVDKVKPEELESAKAKLKGDFIRSLERPETIARFAVNQRTQNLPDDFYTNYLKSIDRVTTADVSAAMKSTVYPNQTRILIAGKASDFADKVEKLGYPVKYYDSYANPVSKTVPQKVDPSVTAASVAEKYLAAIGGRANVQKINSLTTNASTKVQGMDLTMKLIEARGAKRNLDVKMMGNTMQKIVFDGKKGYLEMQGQKQNMPATVATEMAKDQEIFPEINFSKNPNYIVSGIEKYNGEDSYAIKHDGNTYYYSVKTGLKTGEVKTEEGQSVPTTYSDYKDVAGVKLPYKFSQKAGGMDMDFTVTAYEVNQAKDADFK